MTPSWFNWLPYILLTVFACTLITGIARFAYAIFGQLQAPLGEWMLTFFVPAGVLPLVMAVFPNRDPVNTEKTVIWLIIMVLLIFAAFLGSAWGWQTMKRLGEQRPWPRFWLLVRGWLLVPGFAGAFIFLLESIFLVIAIIVELAYGSSSGIFSPGFWYAYLGFGAASVLALPAMLVEWRIRRDRRL